MAATPEEIEPQTWQSETQQTQDNEPKLGESSRGSGRFAHYVVDDNHPFDINSYISNYTGKNAAQRLIFIANIVPPLANQAYLLALQYLRDTRDVNLYMNVVSAYNSVPHVGEAPVDQLWMDETVAKNVSEKEKLEVDLRTYTSNMIKESIRMSHRELGKYYRAVGDHNAALKHHLKSREFFTTGAQMVEMSLSMIEIMIEQQTYAHITTYVYKAESTLEMGAGPSGSGSSKKGAQSGQQDRDKVQTKLDFAGALAELGQGRYEKAAYGFLKLGKNLDDWYGTVTSAPDIAIYGTLCALASLSRSAIKAAVLDSPTFNYFLQQEPYVREMLDAYMASKFKDVLSLLDRYSTRHAIDIHLSAHLPLLTQRIRDRALVLYFQPFANVHLGSMAQAFGIELSELEASVVKLIQDGSVKARIDSTNKILKAKDQDPRTELYRRAITAGSKVQSSTRKLILRSKLIQADLVVKAPKPPKEQQVTMQGEGRVHEITAMGIMQT